jgi:hypothetical protein
MSEDVMMSKENSYEPAPENLAYLQSLFPKLSHEEIRLLDRQIGDLLMAHDYTASKKKGRDLTDGDDVLA